MPRPKRTKVAPSVPAPRVRKSSKPTTAVATTFKARESTFDDIYDASDREQGAVTSARHVRKSKGKEKAAPAARDTHNGMEVITSPVEQDARISTDVAGLGNLGQGSAGDDDELEDLIDQSSSPAIEVGRRSTVALDSSTFALGNLKRRVRQPSILGRAAETTRSSSVESELAEGNGLASVGKNTSILSMGNFKRRPRQPSIIGRNAAHVRSSSVGLDMGATPAHVGSYKMGTFKRRAREQSILRTAQKERQSRPHFDDDDESEDDFNPEDESTPLNLVKTRTEHSFQSTSSTTPGSNPRKRKLSAVQVPQSSPPLPSVDVEDAEDVVPATGTHLSDEEAASSADEQEIQTVQNAHPEEPWSDIMAPPQSSSPTPASPEAALPRASTRRRTSTPASPEIEPPRGRRRLRARTPLQATQDSPISSPPSLTHSPNRPVAPIAKGRGKRQPALPTTFSTAQLQALLPRRRRRPAADPFDIVSSGDEVDVSGLASDDDELSHLIVRPPTRQPAGLITRTPAPLKRGPKSKASQKTATKRTYGSRTSDKENEEAEVDPNDSLAPVRDDDENGSPENSQELEKRVGKELKKAARKFEEVDKWELEFEDVTASSSSPRDAR